MNITIKQLERNTADDAVVTAHWSAVVEDTHTEEGYTDVDGNEVAERVVVDYSASAYGTQSFSRDESSPEFIPFEDLTEETVVGWLTLDEGLEANLLAKIEEQKTPSTVTGIPWAVEEELPE